jgi:hypothetical protein
MKTIRFFTITFVVCFALGLGIVLMAPSGAGASSAPQGPRCNYSCYEDHCNGLLCGPKNPTLFQVYRCYDFIYGFCEGGPYQCECHFAYCGECALIP